MEVQSYPKDYVVKHLLENHKAQIQNEVEAQQYYDLFGGNMIFTAQKGSLQGLNNIYLMTYILITFLLELINDKTNYYLSQIKEGENAFEGKSVLNFLSTILMKKDNTTGWTEIQNELNDFCLLKYLEEKNLIVKRIIEVIEDSIIGKPGERIIF